MTDHPLTLRALNRATLARQMLLERATRSISEGIEHLVGLQAQYPASPYIGLWSRLAGFTRADLDALIDSRRVVRATFQRATLHLLTAADYLRFRGTIQTVLDSAQESIAKQRIKDGSAPFDRDALLAAARTFLNDQPRTFAEITTYFGERLPDVDAGIIRYTIRTQIPLVQVPTNSTWRYPGSPAFTLAETWLGTPIPTEPDVKGLIRRYLAAFGPATLSDIQTWSGLAKLNAEEAALSADLRTYRGEGKITYLDLPDAPLPDAETPAPVRFLPEFDNLLLAHTKRTRVIADVHRKKVFLPGLRVAATFLIDGFVAGVWTTAVKKGEATLTLEPFVPLTKLTYTALSEEGERLIRLVAAEAKTFAVRISE
ncbi:MAG TPA: winged helix DNA-binding domain-containing protein [Aggregatilineales bacterium]|nr:winged helix DNA-binding domain-containing protein [Anaerolineales bacterium]HRE46163.1 winged helix DNA-binding domain-containing protein [Aggregatilineales bacterium]